MSRTNELAIGTDVPEHNVNLDSQREDLPEADGARLAFLG